ncbi:MAG: MlaD family protein, partial [Burkholderiaceae bacterium]|nr:MlaD family protein [Burkholderiaceae bacterium]
MENKSHALLAGLFTLVLLAAVLLGGWWLNRDKTVLIPYVMATRLSVSGLSPQAAVRYRGLNVGKVNEIRFDSAVPGQILVFFGVRPETPMTEST